MRSALLLLAFLVIFTVSRAQRFTVSGYISDGLSGENLIGASVMDQKTIRGITANAYGYYTLTLKQDSVSLSYSFAGYKKHRIQFYLDKDTIINVALESATLDEVVIESDPVHEATRMSSFTVPIQQLNKLPAFFGETDVLKFLQLVPGVQSGSEGSTGLYVRGGGADQNLIILDGVPVYNASHLFGFFSVFNTAAINHVELIKGGFPARYGGRLSSVVDISMKNGNLRKMQGEASIGLISSRFTLEGPIVRDKTSFIVSGRRTYIDVLAQPFIRRRANGGRRGYYFYDLNLKVNHIINNNNRIFFSTYLGDDKGNSEDRQVFSDGGSDFASRSKNGLQWGNFINALRWNHTFSSELFLNVTATYSRYRFNVFRSYTETNTSANGVETNFFSNEYQSGIEDRAVKVDFEYNPDPRHSVRFGMNAIFHKFSPGVYAYSSSVEADTTAGARIVRPLEMAAYAEDDFHLNDRISLNAGIHLSGFLTEKKWYTSLQPRITSRVLIADDLSLRASWSTMTQYIHLLTNVGIGLPTDLWVPSTARIAPQQANQIALGVTKTYKSIYEITGELYYKKMSGLIEYKDGASYLNIEGDWQDKVADQGKGTSYGLEVLLRKKTGRLNGWIGYTLSKTSRQFEQLNFGREFPYKYDRRHDISVAMTYSFTENRDLSMVWVYGSGNAMTLPIATYEAIGDRWGRSSQALYYGDRNSYRTRSYHRLDVSYNLRKQKKYGIRTWTFALYNVYNRLNPFFIDIDHKRAENKLEFVEYALFPIMPSVSYSFKF